MGFPGAVAAVFLAGLDAGIEEDDFGGVVGGVFEEGGVAAFYDPVGMAGGEGVDGLEAGAKAGAYCWLVWLPGNGVEIEVGHVAGLGNMARERGFSRP